MSTDDWRLQGQAAYLTRRTLRWATWTPYRVDWDHDHCEFCNAEISHPPIDERTEFNPAWVTDDDSYHWVCERCFVDFRDAFNWTVAS